MWPCTVPSAPVLSNAPCAFSNRIPWPRQRPSLSLTAWGIGPTARQGTWPSPVTRKLGAFPLRFLRTQSSPSPGPATPHPHPQLNACSFSFTGVLLVGGGGRGGAGEAWAQVWLGGRRMIACLTRQDVGTGTATLNCRSYSRKASGQNHSPPLGRSTSCWVCISPINMAWALLLVKYSFTAQHFFAKVLHSNSGLPHA